MIASNLQSTLATVTADDTLDDALPAEPAASANSVVHDDYCAIHDEYGTCTCGALASVETSADA